MTFWNLILATLVWSAGTALGYVQVNIAETNVYLGQVFNVDFVVKASEKPPTPLLSESPEFNIRLLDDGHATSEANTWLYRLSFRATTEGRLHIPSFKFGDLQSTPIAIQASKPASTDRMRIKQQLSSQSVFIGEPILLTTTWDSTFQFGAIKAVDFHFPVLNDPRFQVLDLYEPTHETDAKSTGLPVHGTRVLARRASYTIDETEHQSLAFRKILIPKKAGKINLPPSTLLCAAETETETTLNPKQGRRSAFQYPAYFDNIFFDQNVTGDRWTRIYTESKSIALEVKPLPTDGRPSIFNGMVGDFTIHVEAAPVEVRVGDPVTLTITITSTEFMETIFFPRLREQPLLINRFKIPNDRSLPRREEKSKIYTQTIRPLSEKIDEVPPIQLAFFNPDSNAYITVQSKAISLNVLPAKEIVTTTQSALHASDAGIRHNYENPDMLTQQRRPFVGSIPLLTALFFLFIPPLLIGGFFLRSFFSEKKHQIHRTAKAARAYSSFRKNTAYIPRSHTMKRDIYSTLDQALRAYLGDRLHLNPGALSFRDAEQHLQKEGATRQTLHELKTLFSLCEAYRFTSDYNEQGDAKTIVRNATRTVKTVERILK